MKRTSRYKSSLLIWVVVVLSSISVKQAMAQEEKLQELILKYNDYGRLHREVAYFHLNKSTFIKGENIGFSGYIFNKDSKVPSKQTRNVYCTIVDENNKTVKSKLLKANNGFTHNFFKVDSTFKSGDYTFKAYTNWMRNFDEPNAFSESIRIIDPEEETSINSVLSEAFLDAQFLPEGGHFVHSVKTNVGVIIKDARGLGVSNVVGNIYDSKNEFVATFRTNSLGIGKFQLVPDKNLEYTVKITHLSETFEFKITNIHAEGITMNISNLIGDVAIAFITNERTLKNIYGKSFKMTVHNGKRLKRSALTFERNRVVKIVGHDDLFPGINVFTLFDEYDRPLVERMFFNYQGINLVSSGPAKYTKVIDSVNISVPIPQFADSSVQNSNISISVLPEETRSYNRHHSMISQVYLQPYLNSYIESGHYYFTNIDRKKKYELDNLLLTQGWSSYNWEKIFNTKVTDDFAFEDGIVIKANPNKINKRRSFLIYPLKHNESVEVKLPENENNFTVTNLYPQKGEALGVAALNKKGQATKPHLNLQFFPSKIPKYHTGLETLPTNPKIISKTLPTSPYKNFDIKQTQILDEVVVEADLKKIKMEKLKADPFIKVDVFDDVKRRMNLTLAGYLSSYLPQYVVKESQGTFDIYRRIPTSLLNKVQRPIIFLDDMLMSNNNVFYAFNMNTVDYITVNTSGLGETFLGANGVIKIYTSLDFIKKREVTSFEQFEFPLAFAENKKFYTPKYESYDNSFFKLYGILDWIPDGKVDADGNLKLTVNNPSNNNIKLFIEGVSEKGDFISEIKVLNFTKHN